MEINNISQSIKFMEQWIEMELHELNGDTESDYAKYVLSGHKHIKIAIDTMRNTIDPTRGYQE